MHELMIVSIFSLKIVMYDNTACILCKQFINELIFFFWHLNMFLLNTNLLCHIFLIDGNGIFENHVTYKSKKQISHCLDCLDKCPKSLTLN